MSLSNTASQKQLAANSYFNHSAHNLKAHSYSRSQHHKKLGTEVGQCNSDQKLAKDILCVTRNISGNPSKRYPYDLRLKSGTVIAALYRSTSPTSAVT